MKNEDAKFDDVEMGDLVPDVRAAADTPEDEDDIHLGGKFRGPGFIGQTEDGELVFSLSQVVPGCKSKYYFAND